MLAGGLSAAKHKLVLEWVILHKMELFADWQLAVNGKKPIPIPVLVTHATPPPV